MGRITFLPLNILKNKTLDLNKEIRNTNGFIGVASELIEYSSKFKIAVNHVLGRTIIAENMDSAIAIAKKAGFSFKIVTLSGEVVNPGGALTGGSIYNKSLNVIGRKRQIEEFKQKIDDSTEAVQNLNIHIKSGYEKLKALDDTNLNFKDCMHSENIEITKFQGRIDAIDLETEKLRKNYQVSSNETLMLNNKLRDASKELLEGEEKLRKLQQRGEELSAEINKLETKLSSSSNDTSSLKDNLTANLIEKAKLEEIVSRNKSEIKRVTDGLEELNGKINLLKKQVVNSKENIEILINKMEDNNKEATQIGQYLKKMDREFQNSDVEKINIKHEISRINEKIEQQSIIIGKTEEDNHRLELNLTKIETEYDSLLKKLNEDYDFTYAEGLQFKRDIADVMSYKQNIDEIKKDIARLGNVNVGAIEEFKMVKEKYSFMSVQKKIW